MTTAIDSTRGPARRATEEYVDAFFVRDNMPLYFGNDGDVYLKYNTTSGVLVSAGVDWRLSDTQKLQLGDDGDFGIAFNGSYVATEGADVRLSDTQRLQVGDGSDLQIWHDGTNTYINNGTGEIRVTGGHVRVDSDVKIYFGNGNDYIYNNGANLYIKASDSILQIDTTSSTLRWDGFPESDPNTGNDLFVSDAGGRGTLRMSSYGA